MGTLKSKSLKKKQEPKSATGIKYSDKSKGQPELLPIYDEIKKLLMPYEKGNMKLRGGADGNVGLINEMAVVIDGRKKDEIWFAYALIQKGYVGFYYMPIYMQEKVRAQISPELMKCLKGKACFHIKKFDPVIFEKIKEALAIGYKNFKEQGWI